MSTWDKLINKVKGEPKKDEQVAANTFEEIVEREYHVDIGNLWKLNLTQLAEIVQKYDKAMIQCKKKLSDTAEEARLYREKFESADKERKNVMEERDQINLTLQDVQKHLNIEIGKSIKVQQDLTLAQNQNNLLKQKLEQFQSGGGAMTSSRVSKKVEDFESTTRVVMNPDSQKLMFTNEDELQTLRDDFELIQHDLKQLIEKLKSENGGQLPKKNNKENNNDEEDQEEEEEEEEEEDNVEDYLNNLQISFEDFDENFKHLRQSLNKLANENNQVNSNHELVLKKFQKEIDELKGQLREEQNKKKEVTMSKSQLERDFVELNTKFNQEKETMQVSQHSELDRLKKAMLENQAKWEEEREDLKDQNQAIWEELEQAQNDLKECESVIRKLNQDIANIQKENENKLIQERLKHEQVNKENSKLDEKYNQYKKDIQELTDKHDMDRSKIEMLSEKRIEDKKKIKEMKTKISEMQDNIKNLSQKNRLDMLEKEKLIGDLKDQLKQFKDKDDIKQEVQKQTLQKDMQINNLGLQLESQVTLIKQKEDQILQIQEKMNNMLQENQISYNTIKQLKEKREVALAEIKRLTYKLDMVKNTNPRNQQKYEQLQNMLDKADKSFNSEHQGQNHTSDSGKMAQNLEDLSPLPQNSQRGGGSVQTEESRNFQRKESSSTQQQQAKSFALKELRCLQLLKADLEVLYKDYIKMAFQIEENQMILSFEKRFNDQIKKTQDLMDHLEDLCQ